MSFDVGRRVGNRRAIADITPLTWESHGVNKAKFKAKPWLWGEWKRETIYAACAPDLRITPPPTFKRPSQEAADVWPV